MLYRYVKCITLKGAIYNILEGIFCYLCKSMNTDIDFLAKMIYNNSIL